ncbi:Alkanesulfonate monooxygenase [Corynebacterium deserti GIMN1.010]|uniref:Alkanesulfonate monooxygenase n=1 Tax=Corynebacterium deserti GIMN1.010 TaxID=931089 RepID=A0A0M4CDJ7_9CORY|nr:LLM class flavin-dependent oxidoreductase [Corynebacterium deserti]ALC05616.1 Alkanesulfonate monooxygenase [Corynebacterium deserti GIMN1.010]
MTSIEQTAHSQLTFHWFLSTSGDSRGIIGGGHGAEHSGTSRELSHTYLKQIALSAETNGFESVLTPTGTWCDDAWLTDASLIDATDRLKFLVALRPGQIGPTLSAQMAATFQRLSNNRLLINVVTGGEDAEQRAYGDFLDKNERYERCGEFLDIVERLWRGETVNHDGKHLRVENARLANPPEVIPQVLFGGSSPIAGEVASRYADTYLTWGEPPAQVAEKINWINSLAQQHNRTVSHGIRFHMITRDTTEEAWAAAEKLVQGITPELVAKAQAGFATSKSEGQRRMTELHNKGGAFTENTTARDLEIYPNVWAGVGLLRGGAGTALVGSHAEVADRIEEYASLGLDNFVLSGYPNLEEAFHFGEGVIPELLRRGVAVKNREKPALKEASTSIV